MGVVILCHKRSSCKHFLGVAVSETALLTGLAPNSVTSAQWVAIWPVAAENLAIRLGNRDFPPPHNPHRLSGRLKTERCLKKAYRNSGSRSNCNSRGSSGSCSEMLRGPRALASVRIGHSQRWQCRKIHSITSR